MLERIWKARRDERGFTLIELIMVLVILGILLALALPAYLGTRRKAYLSEADQHLQEMRTQAWLHYVERNSFDGFSLAARTSTNWTYPAVSCSGTSTCVMSATNANLLGGGPASVTLTLSNTGNATVSSSGF